MWRDFYLGRPDEAEAAARTLLEIADQMESRVCTLDAAIVQTVQVMEP